ncbi:MAG: hypothetical protein AAF441_05685 [Pseudomonadota bacterium]
MLKILGNRGSYDVDCFDYDSRQGTIAEARACLLDRIKSLKNHGYREFALITHSTGGIVALDLILSEGLAVTPAETKKRLLFDPNEGLKLRGLYAWAIPINGLLPHANFAGKVARFWAWIKGEQEAILAHLSPGSSYLNGLHAKLRSYDDRLGGAVQARHLRFAFGILQGQEKDFVVRSVLTSDTWWPSNLQPVLVDTDAIHILNVGRSGTKGYPKFPTIVSDNLLKLAFGLHPRFDPFFTRNAPRSRTFRNHRLAIADGVVGYASHQSLFRNANSAISTLVGRMFLGEYRRDPDEDSEIAKKITGLIADWFQNNQYAPVLEVATKLVKNLEIQIKHATQAGARSFGGDSQHARRTLTCRLREVLADVAGAKRSVVLASLASHQRDLLSKFEAGMIDLFSLLMDPRSIDPVVYECAFTAIAETAKRTSPGVIRGTKLLATLMHAAVPGRSYLNPARQEEFAKVFGHLVDRPEMRNETLAILSANVADGIGKGQPLWRTFMTNTQIRALGLKLAEDGAPSAEQLSFLLGVIRSAGRSGNVPRISVDIARKVIASHAQAPQSKRESVHNAVLLALRESPYPDFERVLRKQMADAR